MTAVKAHAAFGDRLARHRRDRHWSLQRAAIASGVGWMTIHRAEHGHDIRVSAAAKLAAAYGTTVDALLNGEPLP